MHNLENKIFQYTDYQLFKILQNIDNNIKYIYKKLIMLRHNIG